MMLVRAPDKLVKKLIEVSNSQQQPFTEYISEILGQALRAHNLNCSLEGIVTFYERETTKETWQVNESLVSEVFERLLASKLSPMTKAKFIDK
jgi:hypothetical protein